METPDFDQIARTFVDALDDEWNSGSDIYDLDGATTRIAEQLRQVWNARGAADIAKIEADLPGVETYLRSLNR